MWKLFEQEKSSPKLSVEPIKFLVEAREGRESLEALRDKELTELTNRWDKTISLYMEDKVNSVRRNCLHTHVLQAMSSEYAEYFGDTRGSVFVGFYCVACGQFSAYKPETSTTITQATSNDIRTLYGLK